MRQFFPVEDLARDERFVQTNMAERIKDPRVPGGGSAKKKSSRSSTNKLTPDRHDASDRARGLMHGIMVGEIQALEGAGRTAHDFDAGDGSGDTIPFALKLDMARQAWDEARHVEISAKLSTWMGTELGEFQENTVLFEAACSNDPVLRLAGVNRALEGLAIDVFTQMKEFGDLAGDPFLEFCEDWMLADEVTHVKMGSDWLRKVTENDPDRRAKALEFQQVVDKLFSFGGARGDTAESSFQLARRFRELAGFTDDEVETIAGLDQQALVERKAAINAMQAAVADS
ncbi:MAG: DUF455 family protein [Ilumatobacter sp.]|nr:DUF455 family protein [Ilumatobacter sp.]